MLEFRRQHPFILRSDEAMMDSMRWSQPSPGPTEGEEPPTIKNHSVTHFNGYLFCFGGYDGHRNHMTLLLYDLKQQVWLRPAAEEGDNALMRNNSNIQDVIVSGTPPPGRNGHTATLATELGDDESGRIIIIGGWLGAGPLAASDMHVLDVTESGRRLRWYQPAVRGLAPGPCNMHSADYVASRREVYVFRGGNGREYLNDLHALNVDSFEWRKVETTGPAPQPRANHSSAIIDDELFVFGGWNGTNRLNDIHILDTTTSTWTCPHVGGVLPHPRAGMTLTALRGRLYLFGGSGSSSKCFQDLQILDRKQMTWLDVMQNESPPPSRTTNHDRDGQLDSHTFRHYNGGSRNSSGPEEWRSRVTLNRTGSSFARAAPNPNDEEAVPTIVVEGHGPGRRAGHTATAVTRRIYVFGGSCGSDYLGAPIYVLDTDPTPVAAVRQLASLQLFERRIRHFYNNDEFSDVTFLVEGRRVYGHKMILSIVSDCFRAMFTTGFRESEAGAEIEIPGCSYDAFLDMMNYIYTGKIPKLQAGMDGGIEVQRVVDLLEIADQFMLDHLREVCEQVLQPTVNSETVEYWLQVAQKTNASQLAAICEHFIRNQVSVETTS